MLTSHRFRLRAGALVAAVALVALAGCVQVTVSDTVAVTPPDAGAIDFAESFAMDEGRIVANAEVGGSPVVYVYDRSAPGWSHSATITPGPGATGSWGRQVAVSGDTIAIADRGTAVSPGVSGSVEIYDLAGSTWTQGQSLRLGPESAVTSFGRELAFTEDALLVADSDTICGSSCPIVSWTLFTRAADVFSRVETDVFSPGSQRPSVGVDRGRIALGTPVFGDEAHDENGLTVLDTTSDPVDVVVDEVVSYDRSPYPSSPPYNSGYFAAVDLSGELLAYESCCSTDSSLHIRRDSGSGYQPEATFPKVTSKFTPGISALPEAVLVADHLKPLWYSYVLRNGRWRRGNDLPAPVPDRAGGDFPHRPVAVGNEVAVLGDEVLQVLTVDTGPSGLGG